MEGTVRPHTCGVDWVLVDAGTGRRFDGIGTTYAGKVLRKRRDDRPLTEAGIEAGRRLSVRLSDR